MPALTLVMPARRSIPPAFSLIGDGGTRVDLPYPPVPVSAQPGGAGWTELDRDGRAPLLVLGAGALDKMQYNLTLARPSFEDSVEDMIAALRKAFDSTERFVISYGPQEAGLWRITQLTFSHEVRQAGGTGIVTRSTANVTVTAAGPAVGVGPLSGGYAPPAPPPPPVAAPAPSTRTYVFKAGDTLWTLAATMLGNPLRWPEIAALSGITDPRTIPIGFVATVPGA